MKIKFNLKPLAFMLLIMVMPLWSMAQTKNVISTHRVFPKIDKVSEFERALANHAQKYHSGDAAWRVFAIQTGPDMGGYQITEGPKTWESEDARGDLGAAHMEDWNKNVAIYLTDKQSAGYYEFIDSLSSVAIGDVTDKINITHVYPKMGQNDNVVLMIKRLQKTWEAFGVSVAVYKSNSSGQFHYLIVTRYKEGLKEKTPGFRKPFKDVYEEVNGQGSYAQYQKDLAEYLEQSWSELLFVKKDLGSK
ncbi:MAG: hypothetical protein WBP43_12490 [Chitinophagales bacterium]